MVEEADRLESEKIQKIQNLKNGLLEILEKTKSKEMIHMEKALAKIEQVEFEAEEVVNCDNDNDLVRKKRDQGLLIFQIILKKDSLIHFFLAKNCSLGYSFDLGHPKIPFKKGFRKIFIHFAE